MKEGFANLQVFPDEKFLFSEEIDVVVAVMCELWRFHGGSPNRGTIILDGQPKGGDAQCIMRMNLKKGAYDVEQVMEGFPSRTSDTVAEESIDAILEWPEKPAYGYQATAMNFGEMETGIYEYGRKKVLVLNTTLGRFLMSAQLAQERADGSIVEQRDDSIRMMKGVAMMLAKMCPKDIVLQRSVEKLMQGATEIELALRKDLNRFFERGQAMELQTWQKWHEKAANSAEGLAVYFG